MRLLITLVFLFTLLSGSAQQVLVVKKIDSLPAIRLEKGENADYYYKKFMMKPEEIARLNDSSKNLFLNKDQIWLSIKNVLLLQCSEPNCVKLEIIAEEGDNLKSLAQLLGNVNPYHLKRLNPTVEVVVPGMPIAIGFIPHNLVTPPQVQTLDSTSSRKVEKPLPVLPNVQKDSIIALMENGQTLYMGRGSFAADGFTDTRKFVKLGLAGNFKTNSGWYDGKFYVLMDEVPAGTLVAISNRANGNYIIAKVVSELPKIKKGKPEKVLLIARISHAGCAALDVWDDLPFDVEISY